MTCKNWFHNGIQGKIFLQCMKPYPKPQKILPKIYQNKTKVKGKSSKCRVQEGMSCINCVQAI